MKAKAKVDAESEQFVKEKTTVTVSDITNQIKGSIMLNTILSVIVGIIPGVFEYMQTNGFTWKSLALGVIAGLLAWFSPSPKEPTPRV